MSRRAKFRARRVPACAIINRHSIAGTSTHSQNSTMNTTTFEEQRASLPVMPEEVTLDQFAANAEYQADDTPPPSTVWKANGRPDRSLRTQPPLRWRLYEVKGQNNLKMDLIWHPSCPHQRIARLRFVSATKSKAARVRHQRRREATTQCNITARNAADSVAGIDAEAVVESLLEHQGSPLVLPYLELQL